MKNLKQINLIIEALTAEKEKYTYEISKANMGIKKKNDLIQKMKNYINDYLNQDKSSLTHTIPTLTTNLDHFIKKIDGIILLTENEIAEIKIYKNAVLEKINLLDQKIKVMELNKSQIEREAVRKESLAEQSAVDDLVSTRSTRSE